MPKYMLLANITTQGSNNLIADIKTISKAQKRFNADKILTGAAKQSVGLRVAGLPINREMALYTMA